jgi:hypothetical protein
MFAPLMFCGCRCAITTGSPAGAVRDAAIVTFAATFVSGAVISVKYPPPNGPSVSELEAVVLVVKTPLAPALCAGVAVGAGVLKGATGPTKVFPLQAHSNDAMTYAPKTTRTNAERIETCRIARP